MTTVKIDVDTWEKCLHYVRQSRGRRKRRLEKKLVKGFIVRALSEYAKQQKML